MGRPRASKSTTATKKQLHGNFNHYALLKYDADQLALLAKDHAGDFKSTVLVRSAIILYAFCLEALINRVIHDFWPLSPSSPSKEDALGWPTVKKWVKVPEVIAGNTFCVSSRPFQYLKPIFDARNDFVHAKPDTYQLVLDYSKNAAGDCIAEPAREHPRYKQIRLYKDPSEWIIEDGVRLQTIAQELVGQLRELLSPRLTDEWLEQDTFIDEKGRTITVKRRVSPPVQP